MDELESFGTMQHIKFEHDIQKRVSVLEVALSHLGQGIILLSQDGQLLFATDVAQQMVDKGDGLAIKGGKLTGVLEADDARLQALRKTVSESDCQSYRNIYIHRLEQRKPYLLLVSKMQLEAEEAGPDGVLIIIKDTHANAAHWQERLKTVFGLTNREADFVVLLTEGRNIKEISIVMDIAEDTARQYLKSSFKKMEVNKQHELVCLAMDSLRKR